MLPEKVLVDACILHGLGRGDIGIFTLFGQTDARPALQHAFQDRPFHDTGQRRAVAVGGPDGVDADARPAGPE